MTPTEVPVGDVVLLQAPGLQHIGGIVHGFTTRSGGVSQGACAELNVSTRVGDTRADVFTNRQRILTRLGRPDAGWVGLKQVHGNDVVQVTRGVGPNICADGLWTTDKNAAIAVLGADCLTMLLCDAAGRAIGAAHAGWRGTQARVGARLVERLERHGCPPDTLVAALGPTIGPCCYEVDADVAAALRAVCPDVPEAVVARDDGKFMVDLWCINRRTLTDAGLRSEAIDTVRACTRCDTRFFSHRREHGHTGRQAGVIAFATGC